MNLDLWTISIIALSGGLGAVARYLLDETLQRRYSPLASLTIINTLGSALLGAATATLTHHPTTLACIGVGLCGGFTTFSTAMVLAASPLPTHPTSSIPQQKSARRKEITTRLAWTTGMLLASCAAFLLTYALPHILA